MARRESRATRDYNRGMEEMRKQMEGEMQESEEKLRTAAKIMVLKEKESWRSDREQLLDERRTTRKKLSVTEEENRKSKSDLQEEKDKIRNREEEIWSLHCQLPLEKYDSLWWRKLHEVLEKAAGVIKKRDEQIISLERSLHAEREETERKRGSVEEESSRYRSVKESRQKKVSHLEELLSDKEREISRVNEKRRARIVAHIDTLALLNETQSALKQSQLACDSLDSLYQRELSQREESYQKELSETVRKSREELSTVCKSWERRSQQWEKEQRQLEEMLRAKDEIWIHEEEQRKEDIQRLTDDNLQLQELLMKKEKKKKSFWSWSCSK